MFHLSKKLVLAASTSLTLMVSSAHAETVTVAVAANFIAPMQVISQLFEAQTPHQLKTSTGSSGKFYAQIKNGAPFEVLLSADAEIPAQLERDGLAVPGSRFTYANGQLVLWSNTPGRIDGQANILREGRYKKIAIANPELAPYGRAALQTLQALGVTEQNKAKIVMGENIGQTYQFVLTGNAEIGFVAASQVYRDGKLTAGSAWLVPDKLHETIRQDAVLLDAGKHSEAAMRFLSFLQSDAARAIIESYGYSVPALPIKP
jgi:molybdate transport system substrate-binding protein